MPRLRLLLSAAAAASAAATAVVACTTPSVTAAPFRTSDIDSGTPKTGDDDDQNPLQPTGPKPESDPPLPDGGKPPGRVYAHTADTLYLYDPLIKSLKMVAPFSGLDVGEAMLDIALDKDSVMYGTTYEGFVKIDPVSARCTYVKKADTTGQYPNALAFVPTGTVDPTKEALVGYKNLDGQSAATSYVRIDLATGELTTIGNLNPANQTLNWQSSGDIISMIRNGNRAFVTVKLFNPDGGTVDDDPGTDSLAEIDPKTGFIKAIIGDIGQSNLYGLGQWAGTAYGFNDQGNIIQIDLTTGAGTTIASLVDDAGVAAQWYGAGVTTDSPTKP